jgi:hypothetical protein
MSATAPTAYARRIRSAHSRRVRDIAEEYRLRGYRVSIEPGPEALPDFLRPYRPEIVAEGEDESVVVEIRSPGTAREPDSLTELARTIQEHPGWRLDLVLVAGVARPVPEPIDRKAIYARLREGERLAESGMAEAALLITWSAAEAAMRWACVREEVELPDHRPATLITRLYSDGLLDRADYDTLMRYMAMRNNVIHGYREDGVDAVAVAKLRRLTKRLLRAS